MKISSIIQNIKSHKSYKNQIVHIEDIPLKEPQYSSIELKPLMHFALDQIGIKQLYTHQVEAIEKIRNGKDVVLVTSTASGKSMAYMIPVFESAMDDPNATALYIAPLNALVNDQYQKFIKIQNKLGIETDIGKFTGSQSQDEKRIVKNSSKIVITNPEMVHLSILGWNWQWKRFLSNLKYIIVDESHYYRGVMGSNMANVFARLNRMCDYYGSKPQYICCSATIGNPGKHTSDLIGRDVTVIDKDGSGHGPQKFVFWNPPLYVNKSGFTVRRSSLDDTSNLFSRFVQDGLQTIVFTKSRQGMERLFLAGKKSLRGSAQPNLTKQISSYRGGYFNEEREKIEKQLSEGFLRGVFSTNALELGIDIGGLDACIIDRYPGTVMSTKQQAGRAGRGNTESIVVLVGGSNALDQYYMQHPNEFFERNSEEAVLNVSNQSIQAGHILCAAKEIPLTENDKKFFGEGYTRMVELLTKEGLLINGGNPTPEFSHMDLSIRGIDKNTYSLVTSRGGQHKPIEKDLERSMAYREGYEGAVYLHMSTPYLVNKLDHDKKEIHVEEARKLDYFTRAIIDSDICLKEKYDEKILPTCKDVKVGLGDVEVIEHVTGYKQLQHFTEDEKGEFKLDMPPLTLETIALWLEFPDRFMVLVENHGLDFAGGIHAIEHAMIAMYPLHLLADRNDIGGVSTPQHADLKNMPGIFIYDGHEGGVGYAEKGFDKINDILDVTLKAIKTCPCTEGCPICIQSPKCGNHNKPLDKQAAIMILHELLGKSAYVPPEPKPKESPTPVKKTVEPVNTKDALNRVRQQLRRDDVLARIQNAQKVISKPRKASSPEEQKILDRMKEMEELQKQHEKNKLNH
ncbi:DEAD/DEAH box helicase [Patescibacteria group bacterium]|nr:DEAD/DEAH box helicase [Patescibacteria group bacterium]